MSYLPQMLNEKDLKKTTKLIANFVPINTYFETQILVPRVRERLQYLSENFTAFKTTCLNGNHPLDIDRILANLIDSNKITLSARNPTVGKAYLSGVAEQCDRFIAAINEILQKYPYEETQSAFDKTKNFLNEASNFCQSIVCSREKLFTYSLRPFLQITNENTNQLIIGEPLEYSLILGPFQTRLNEVANVAETTIQSIQDWTKQIGEQKTKQVELISNLAELKSVKWNFWCQVAVIVLTIALVWGAEKANIFLEKRELETVINKLQDEIKGRDSIISELKKPKAENIGR